MGICKLCGEEKPLIKKSHIISDFLHSDLYDEGHRLVKFHPSELLKDVPRISRPPSATYQGGILCKKCEDHIGTFETYISDLLKDELPIESKLLCNLIDEEIIEITNLNYSKTKLFLLSLLWRTSISDRPDFENVKLGPYEEKIRLQILEGTASKEDDIRIAIFRLNKDEISNFIGSPLRHRDQQTSYYSMIILGYVILFLLKETKLSESWRPHSLLENGNLYLFEMPKNKVKRFVAGYHGLLKKRG